MNTVTATRRMKRSWGFAGIFGLALILSGCSNPVVMPDAVHIHASDYRPDVYPYMLTIDVGQRMRFNPHRFEFGNDVYTNRRYIYLKGHSGVFQGDGFHFTSPGYPTVFMGSITISGGEVIIDVYLAQRGPQGEPDPATREASSINGHYKLVRDY